MNTQHSTNVVTVPALEPEFDDRTLTIDAGNIHHPGSVFISAGSFTIEVDRAALVAALSGSLGLVDPLEGLL